MPTATTPPALSTPDHLTPRLEPPRRAPRLMAAADAIGTPYATALVSVRNRSYGICSAAVWKPTVLMTAAHCVIDDRTGDYIDPSTFSVVTPGTGVALSGGTVQTASPARVVRSYVVDGFRLRGTSVPADDIAFVVLDRPLSETTFTRLASTIELARWYTNSTPVGAIGYGFPAPDVRVADVPREAALPIIRVVQDFRDSSGLAILSAKSDGIDACSGDSGGPRFVADPAGVLLLGNIAGGSCDGRSGAGVIGFTGMSYRALANEALADAGLPTIPSSPSDLRAARVGGTTTVWWQPPADSAQTVVGYDVLDITGALLCSTADTVCTFPTGNAGAEGLSVRARNVQGEGDASLAPSADMLRADAPRAKVLKARTKKKPVRIRISPVNYPAVSEYLVTTPKGEPVCSIDATASPLQCRVKVDPGKYRFRVVAVTPEGTSVPSRMSKAVRVAR